MRHSLLFPLLTWAGNGRRNEGSSGSIKLALERYKVHASRQHSDKVTSNCRRPKAKKYTSLKHSALILQELLSLSKTLE